MKLLTNFNNLEQFDKTQGLGVSNKYVVVNTKTIADKFADAGFQLHSVRGANVRNDANAGFQKHVLRFRSDKLQLRNVNDSVPEILLKNSYNGSSAYVLMFGVYRLVCSNGLVVGTNWSTQRVIHIGKNALDKAILAAENIASQAGEVADAINRFSAMHLSNEAMSLFAADAAKLLLSKNVVNFDATQLLKSHRIEDNSNSVWHVFNRIQENIIRGGVQMQIVNANAQLRNYTSRPIKAIDRNLKINKELWRLAELYAA